MLYLQKYIFMETKKISTKQTEEEQRELPLPTIDDIAEKIVPYLINKKDWEYLLIIHLLSDTFLSIQEIIDFTGLDMKLRLRWVEGINTNFGLDKKNDEMVFTNLTRQKVNLKLKKIQRACGLNDYEPITTHTLRKVGALHKLKKMENEGVPRIEALRKLQRELGHYSLESVCKYLGFNYPLK